MTSATIVSIQPARRILVDTMAAAAAVQRPAATIRGWAHRGLITPHGKDQARRTLYDLADVYRTARQRRRPAE